MTVCGASMYRERLHIPAEIDGGQLSAIQERWAEAQRGAVLHWVETFPDIPRFVRRIILQSYLTPDPEELLARYC